MEIAFIIIVLIFVGILLLINFDDSLKSKLNIIIGLLFTIVILLTVNTYMQYPQYKNSRDIRNTLQQFDSPDEYGRRTHGSAGQGEQAKPGQ